jgi:RNA polymerase sigma-70 factor (ECF subfamily)
LRNSAINKTRHLVALAKDGDESALDWLCRVYSERVRWVIRLRMGREIRSKLESMDLVQDALIYAIRDLGNFTYKNEGDFLLWLSKIAENRVRDSLDKLHANKRDIHREVRLDSYGPATGDSFAGAVGPVDYTTPSAIMSKTEDLARLARAIDSLKPEYRKVIVLTKIEGLSYKEIADQLGKSPDAVRMLVSRAIAALSGAFENI